MRDFYYRNHYYIVFLLCTIGISEFSMQAQVGFGTSTPSSSAALHIYSTDKGFLMPRMEEKEKNAIVNPAVGLTIYQTDGIIPGIYYYSGIDHGWLPYYQVGIPKTPILKPNTVQSRHIQNGAVTGDVLSDGAINSSKIKSGSITNAKIAENTLTGTHIQSGEITPEKIAQSGASAGDVWIWNGTSWGVGPLSAGLKYSGIWDAATNSPDLSSITPVEGTFYVISKAGTQTLSGTTYDYKIGDWVIYTSGRIWERIAVQYPVSSVFGRSASSGGAIITPERGDYTWAQIDKANSTISSFEDVDISSTPLDGQVLLWDDADRKFKPKYEHGHPLNQIGENGISNNAITTDKIKTAAISGEKITNNSITFQKIANRGITDTKIKGPLSLSKLDASGLGDGSILVWNATLRKWEVRDLSGGINYQGVWDATTNSPSLRDGDATTGITGHFYTVINAPVSGTFDFSGGGGTNNLALSTGDWAFYSGSKWTIVRNTAAVVSIFGRTGDVIAQNNDYSWDLLDFTNSKLQDLSNVNSYNGASSGQVLAYTVSGNWEATNDKGSTANPIDGNGIANDAIRGWHIADNQIESKHIKDNAITSAKIAKNSITGAKFKDAAITSAHIKTGTIEISKIQDGAITRTKIIDGAITSSKIKNGSVVSGKIARNAVDSNKIAAGAINEFKFGLGSVTGAKLKAGSITNDKVTANSISGAKIADYSIGTSKIKNDIIDSTKIKNGTIRSTDIADEAIDEFKIKDNAITTEKIALNTITSDNIADGSITSIKIKNGTIGNTKIKNLSLSETDLSNGSITGSKIDNGQIDSRVLANEIVIGDGALTTPNSKAVLEIRSSTKGFLPPRMTTTQRNAIIPALATPTEKDVLSGLMVYDTTDNKLYFWDGTNWKPFF